MAFVNEYIPVDDVKKYGIEEIDRRFLKTTYQPDWTVDRERNIYLRQVASRREEFASQKDYTFYWGGRWSLFVWIKLVVECGAGKDGVIIRC